MSEYQYYEFLAIDQPLSEQDRRKLRAISSRAQITATSFTNEYSYGDLKADPMKMLEQYFDAFVYFANWGSRRLALRLPRQLVDVEALSEYACDCMELVECSKHIILDFSIDDEEGFDDWVEDEGWMSELVALRSDILAGDLRCLYLGWLMSVQCLGVDEDTVSPAVPPGLGELSGPLESLMEFMDLDRNLVRAAVQWSATIPSDKSVSVKPFRDWVLARSTDEKNELLTRVVEGNAVHLRAELLQRFRQEQEPKTKGRAKVPVRDLPTADQLLRMADEMAAEQKKVEDERRAREEAEQARNSAEERKRYLAVLAKREEEAWRLVDDLAATKQPLKYDEAVRLLKDLHDLSLSQQAEADCLRRIQDLCARHSRKPSLLDRIDRLQLPLDQGNIF